LASFSIHDGVSELEIESELGGDELEKLEIGPDIFDNSRGKVPAQYAQHLAPNCGSVL
jgi:hypothetical protein